MSRSPALLGCLAAFAASCAGPTLSDNAEPLRVGTTGDIAPFSKATVDGGFEGIDIDLARDLGRTIGRPVAFVQTTWGTLLDDAVAHRFDLALSAISVTSARSRRVAFSHPYAEHSYVAVVRCADQSRYRSVNDLNRPGVTIFARAACGQCEVRSYSIPERECPTHGRPRLCIRSPALSGEGDMIADTNYERRHHPGLCVALEGRTFNPSVIAVLMPKDSIMP